MNSGIEKLVKNIGPGFATVVLVVGGFLWHLERREQSIEQMAARCHAVSEMMVKASRDIAERLGANDEVVRGNTTVLTEVRDLLRRRNGTVSSGP